MFRWLHIADIHNQIENYTSRNIRDDLIEKVRELAPFDTIFVAGDIFYRGNTNRDQVDAVKDFIKNLTNAAKCELNKVFICAGNHDLKRSKARYRVINDIIDDYQYSTELSTDEYSSLIYGDYCIPFNKIVEQITGIRNESVHYVADLDSVNLVVLNTAVFSGQTYPEQKNPDPTLDDKNLFLCDEKFTELIEKAKLSCRSNKPTIVLGHHGIESFVEAEQAKIISALNKIGADLYLCGHRHQCETHPIKNTNILWQICIGGAFKDNYNHPGFVVGTFDENSKKIELRQYDYLNKWAPSVQMLRPWEDGKLVFVPNRFESEMSRKIQEDSEYKTRRGMDIPENYVPITGSWKSTAINEEYVLSVFDTLAKNHPSVRSYSYIHDIHEIFLGKWEHEKKFRSIMGAILKKDVVFNENEVAIGLKNENTFARDFSIYYCLALYRKRNHNISYNRSLKNLIHVYNGIFDSNPLHYEVMAWYQREQSRKPHTPAAERQRLLRNAYDYDKKAMSELSIAENAGIYNSFASTVSEWLEYDYYAYIAGKNTSMWNSEQERYDDWKYAIDNMESIIKYWRIAWKSSEAYGKHYFIWGRLVLFTPGIMQMDSNEQERVIKDAQKKFDSALECEDSDEKDAISRTQKYKEYINKASDILKQLYSKKYPHHKHVKIQCSYCTEINRRQGLNKPNEDYYDYDEKNRIFMIADGVTRPHQEYEIGSPNRYMAYECAEILCKAVKNYLVENKDKLYSLPENTMRSALIQGNQAVKRYQDENWHNGLFVPCTTFLLGVILDKKLYFYNCCDTVGYIIRNGVKIQFTEYYNWVSDINKYPKEKVYKEIQNKIGHPSGFGIFNGDIHLKDFINISHLTLEYGDKIILASDGLAKYLQATKADILNGQKASKIITESTRLDCEPFQKYADDKTCITIDIFEEN